jgi:predicted PurR-regulated permease PerM
MSRIALNTAAVLLTLTGLAILWQFRGAALIFCMSLALAAAVRPAIEYFLKRGIPVTLAVAATYLPLLALVGLLIFLAVSRLGREFSQMADDSARAYEQIDRQWRTGNWIQQEIARSLPSNSLPLNDKTSKSETADETNDPNKENESKLGHREPVEKTTSHDDKNKNNPPHASQSQADATEPKPSSWELEVVKTLFGLTLSVAGIVFDALLIVVMSIYWSLDQVHFERLWLSLLSAGMRTPARQIWRAIETEIGKYLRSEFLQSLMAGLLLGIGFWLIGCRYPVLLGLLGAGAWLIPWVGVLFAVLGLVVTSLPTLIIGANWQSLAVLGAATLYTCMVLLLLEILVEPRLFDRQRYNTVLIAFLAVSLAMIWGVIGLLAGPPLAVVLQVFGSYLYRRRMGLVGETVQTPAEVAARLAVLRQSLRDLESPRPELMSMVDRLSALVEAASLEVAPGDGDKRDNSPNNRPNRALLEAPLP